MRVKWPTLGVYERMDSGLNFGNRQLSSLGEYRFESHPLNLLLLKVYSVYSISRRIFSSRFIGLSGFSKFLRNLKRGVKMRYGFRVTIFVILYVILGKLSLLLAIPPGYSAPIWPAAGLASAVIVLWGNRYLPAVFLASFLTNLFIVGSGENWQLSSLIAFGASAQAFVVALLLSKVCPDLTRLEKQKNILYTILLGGPVGCLVSASIASFGLLWMGVIEKELFSQIAYTWWIGNSIGSMLLLPLCLILVSSQVTKYRKAVVTLPFVLLLTSVVAIFVSTRNSEENDLYNVFEKNVIEKKLRLEQNLKTTQNILSSINSFYRASDFVSRAEFKEFTNNIIKKHKGVQALEWIPRISFDEKLHYENLAQRDGFENFRIREKVENKMVQVGDRDEYFPVYYLEPFECKS
jgi:hypothetical protein